MAVLPDIKLALEAPAVAAIDDMLAQIAPGPMADATLGNLCTVSLAISAKRIADALESIISPAYDAPAVRTCGQ